MAIQNQSLMRASQTFFLSYTLFKYLSQSNKIPGSVLRSGAMSEWPFISSLLIPVYSCNSMSVTCDNFSYWISSKISSSDPSSSMPIEKSLQSSLPLYEDTPACQALLLKGTNCIISPVLFINTWEETFKPSISYKNHLIYNPVHS